VSSSLYYLFWLAGGLLAIAVASAVIAWRQGVAARESQTPELLEALAAYTEWFGAQRQAVCFQAPVSERVPGMASIASALQAWPEPVPAHARSLLLVHERLEQLLRAHEEQGRRDAEAALDAGQDAAFVALWREHCGIVREIEEHLGAAVGLPPGPHLTLPS
jgi:hypothetical protein